MMAAWRDTAFGPGEHLRTPSAKKKARAAGSNCRETHRLLEQQFQLSEEQSGEVLRVVAGQLMGAWTLVAAGGFEKTRKREGGVLSRGEEERRRGEEERRRGEEERRRGEEVLMP
jgi:hypothetical protein